MVAKKGLAGAKGPLVIIGFISIIFMFIAFNFFYRPPRFTIELISKDLATLQTILQKIDSQCRIIGFENQKNPIDFLNVGSFVGSQVGSIKLAYPKEWKGPYLPINPHYEGIEYQVVRMRQGLFIAPGQGVKLPNGKTIGKDIHLDEHEDMEKMMHDKNALMFDDKPMAVPLKLQMNTLQKMLLDDVVDTEMIS